MVLACSRHLFVRPVISMNQQAWTEAHVAAFAFFDGVPRRLVPDNLRTGVERTDLYDTKINRSYAELAAHYATLIDPARRGKPRDRPRVERPMPLHPGQLLARPGVHLARADAAGPVGLTHYGRRAARQGRCRARRR
ncbi:DDE-type integrase/transposase/recombinase [Amycolatopsis sp. NPDC004625]|uniref:DDE-type integrase/transposase/recombinase n=1 Tax=Amycolatopsis sp. NPDC004625 TaxID=3154670 RepID=UPI0033AF6015